MDGASTERWLIAGLGNPGDGYAGNRHNCGFMVADVLAGRMRAPFKRDRSRARVATGRLSGCPVTLAKPQTFMNLSGRPVAALRTFYKIPVERIVVIHDELDIPFGTIRLKQGGGDNGHNGLRSVTAALGSRDYLRVRVGIAGRRGGWTRQISCSTISPQPSGKYCPMCSNAAPTRWRPCCSGAWPRRRTSSTAPQSRRNRSVKATINDL